MEIKIIIRNRGTREKTVLTAYSDEMAMNMIANAITDGWNVVITEETERLIDILKKRGSQYDCENERA